MVRIRVWLFRLLSQVAIAPPDDPLPRPTPGEIMAVRVLVPTEGARSPSEQQCILFYRLGYRQRASEERSPWKTEEPPGGTTAVFVDKTGQQQAQRELTWLDQQHIDIMAPLKAPAWLEQIETQHSMPAVPVVSPLRKSRLTGMLHAIDVPAVPPVPSLHKKRQLTPLPEPFEEDEDDSWLLDSTDKREAV